jgi:hypothetical protein
MLGRNCSTCDCCPNFLQWIFDNVSGANMRFEVTLEHSSRDQHQLFSPLNDNTTPRRALYSQRLSEPGYEQKTIAGTFVIERPASNLSLFSRWTKRITVNSTAYDLELAFPNGAQSLRIHQGLTFSVTTPASVQSWRRAYTKLGISDRCLGPPLLAWTQPIFEDIMPGHIQADANFNPTPISDGAAIDSLMVRLMPITQLVPVGAEHSPIRLRLNRDGVTAWDVSCDAISAPATFSGAAPGVLQSNRYADIYSEGILVNECNQTEAGRAFYGGGGGRDIVISVSADITNPPATSVLDGNGFTVPARRWRWSQSLRISSMKLKTDDAQFDVMMQVLEPAWSRFGSLRIAAGPRNNLNTTTLLSDQTYCESLEEEE